jgi:hypothetical protein
MHPLHADSCSSYHVIIPGLCLQVYHRMKNLDSFVLNNQREKERGLAKESSISKSSLAGDRCRFRGETTPLEFLDCGPLFVESAPAPRPL